MFRNDELEQAIVADPDNVELFRVYSDWLLERGDARGELIRVQLELENDALDDDARTQLEHRRGELIGFHAASWLGEHITRLVVASEFSRGWVRSLFLAEATSDRDLTVLPRLFMLKRLRLRNTEITDAGLVHISKLKSLQWLKRLTRCTHRSRARWPERRSMRQWPSCRSSPKMSSSSSSWWTPRPPPMLWIF
ncbi:MAG: TIGR02996 domain-containing protein [Proteobacteria bacterium]|nr:TIGR02996 domain-containing protein [Pseudomonadota bacterium]